MMARSSFSGSVELEVKSSSTLGVVCVFEATVVVETVVVVVVLVVFGGTGLVSSMASRTSSEPPLSASWWMLWVLAVFSFRDKGRREREKDYGREFYPAVSEIPLQKRYLLFMRCCARSNFLRCNQVYPCSVCIFKPSLSHVAPCKTHLREDNIAGESLIRAYPSCTEGGLRLEH